MMNKLKFIFVFVAALGMIACSEDEGSSTDSGGISGTWAPTALTYNGTSSITVQGQTVTMDFDATGTDFTDTMVTFNNDGTFDSSGNGIVVEMSMEFMGQTTTQEFSGQSFIENGTWEVNGNIMTVTNEGSEPMEFNIVEMNDTTLHLTGDITDSVQGNEATIHIDMTFTKI